MRNALRPLLAKLGHWYERIAPHLIIPIGLVAMTAMVVAAASAVTNGQQDRRADAADAARDAERARILACVDQYLDLSSATSAKVREATVKRDTATTVRDETLNAEGAAFLRFMVALTRQRIDGVTDPAVVELVQTLRARADAGRALDRAQVALDRAREQNPIPDPPSEFCAEPTP